ncbi:MAG: PAS domain S-box protein [Nitrospirae bacterium]|nr:PAS domain S-box protein [Nitrospirota bacterium]
MVNLNQIIRNLKYRISLTPKMLALTALIGLVVWGGTDHILTKKLREISDIQLSQILQDHFQEDRIRFDNYVNTFQYALTLIISQKSTHDYVEARPLFGNGRPVLKQYSEIPPWLPDASVMRHFIHINFALLIDRKGMVVEVYRALPGPLPPSLSHPSDRILQLSRHESYLTSIDGMPYLLTSGAVRNSKGEAMARLMIAAQLDNDFLIASQGLTAGRKIVGLLAGTESRIIASSRPDILAAGSTLDMLKKRYLVVGKSFFDLGGSELTLQFASFISRSEFESMNKDILAKERLLRAASSLLFILCFAFIMVCITRQIQRLTQIITDISRETLDIQPPKVQKGDQLVILANQFQYFTNEIMESRERLKKQAEELLREKTVYLDNILHSSSLAIMAMDCDFRIKYYNAMAERFFGYEAKEVIGKTLMELDMGKKMGPPFFKRVLEKIREDQNTSFIDSVNMPDGIFFFESKVFSILDKENKLVGFTLISHDITERKRAEQIVQARLRMLEMAAKLSMDDLLQMVLDEIESQTGSVIGFYHFLKDDQETLLLQSWSTNTLQNICTAAGKGNHYPISQAGVWVDCVIERRPVIHNDYGSLLHRKGLPQGHAPVIREMVIPIIRQERIVAIVGMGNKPTDYNATDVEIASLLGDFSWEIVERKRAEAALVESEERYRGLFENMLDGYAYCKMVFEDGKAQDFIYLEVNHAFENLTGLRNVVGRRVTEVIPDIRESNKELFEMYGRVSLTGKSERFEIYIEALKMWFSISVYSPEREFFVAVFDNITERKKAEVTLKKYSDELVRSNKELELFSTIASHDLQEPLRVVTGFAQLLDRRYRDKLDAEANEFIFFIVDGAGRMEQLIKDLLDYSRVTTRGKTFEPVDTNGVVRRALANLKMSVDESCAEITVDALPEVKVDESQFMRLFQNLIGNAVKYRRETAPRIRVSATKDGNVWVFSVADNGIGIDPKYHERIFKIFQRLHDRDKYTGTGIGLAVCRRIVERHGGRIWVESEQGKGSVFYFTIPENLAGELQWNSGSD